MTDTELEICRKAIDHWGKDAQERLFYEEVGELMQAISKMHRKLCGDMENEFDHIAEEIADVEICLAQLKLMYGLDDKVAFFRAAKIRRVEQRMNVGGN